MHTAYAASLKLIPKPPVGPYPEVLRSTYVDGRGKRSSGSRDRRASSPSSRSSAPAVSSWARFEQVVEMPFLQGNWRSACACTAAAPPDLHPLGQRRRNHRSSRTRRFHQGSHARARHSARPDRLASPIEAVDLPRHTGCPQRRHGSVRRTVPPHASVARLGVRIALPSPADRHGFRVWVQPPRDSCRPSGLVVIEAPSGHAPCRVHAGPDMHTLTITGAPLALTSIPTEVASYEGQTATRGGSRAPQPIGINHDMESTDDRQFGHK